MIEILAVSKAGRVIDRAEADDAGGAVCAARTLLDEARDKRGHSGHTVTFLVAGQAVRSNLTRTELS
jgi:hypothetical protein